MGCYYTLNASYPTTPEKAKDLYKLVTEAEAWTDTTDGVEVYEEANEVSISFGDQCSYGYASELSNTADEIAEEAARLGLLDGAARIETSCDDEKEYHFAGHPDEVRKARIIDINQQIEKLAAELESIR